MNRDLRAKAEVCRLTCPQGKAHRGQYATQYDRALGPYPVQHPAPDLGCHYKTDEKVQQHQAGVDRRLPQCDLGVLAGEKVHRDAHEHGYAQHQVLHPESPGPENVELDER